MHETNLNAWACKMTYWENGADELALYALSDLTKQHTIVITSTKPWSTVHPNVVLKDIHDLLNVCSVKLLFLGGNKFGKLRPRPQNYKTPIMVNLPVFPGIETPSEREIETAQSLLLMNTQGIVPLELQEPSVVPNAPRCEDMISEIPDLTDMMGSELSDHTPDKFRDAMEHVIGHVLASTTPTPLTVLDAADSMCAKTVLVETDAVQNLEYALVRPQIEEQIKPCSIKLTRIDSVLSYIPKQNLCETLMHAGRPHTRSKCTPKPPKRGRVLRTTTQTVNYKDPDTTSEEEVSKRKSRSKLKPKPGAAGPSKERVNSQNSKTVHPTQ